MPFTKKTYEKFDEILKIMKPEDVTQIAKFFKNMNEIKFQTKNKLVTDFIDSNFSSMWNLIGAQTQMINPLKSSVEAQKLLETKQSKVKRTLDDGGSYKLLTEIHYQFELTLVEEDGLWNIKSQDDDDKRLRKNSDFQWEHAYTRNDFKKKSTVLIKILL